MCSAFSSLLDLTAKPGLSTVHSWALPCSHRIISSTKPPSIVSLPPVCADVPLTVHMDWEVCRNHS